ncbi:hypothetical protein DESUT3_12870 [Desulfuromonas versatilis]|uniref:AB hydrolase-1 domain-containing protein n=1 Tax=Desulfuromonas versatilis TaxID=2802975 RepID=A0ABN6DVP7_9BACT|nr:alpha/beta fold hydrolase [Desulfuromonas versatilis]BCR04218.1 hypothetical protein DESUT3_12870 [Desulfuromonas versatilis]
MATVLCLFVGLLGLVAAIVATVVVLTFAFAWYESANSSPELVEMRFTPAAMGLAAQLLIQEFTVLMATVLLHPLGWFGGREKPLPAADGTPVILLHGLFQNRICWLLTRQRLRRAGFQAVYSLNLPPWKDLESLTERLAKKVDELRHAGGARRVHLVGHSMGGMIARNYVQIRGGAAKVERCVLLGSPNSGSRLAPFALSPLGKLLVPGADFLKRLAAAERPPGVRFTAIFTRHENMVLPYANARLEGAAEIELSGMGHTSLLYHPRAFQAILEGLQGESE